jgi:hypothetical protein
VSAAVTDDGTQTILTWDAIASTTVTWQVERSTDGGATWAERGTTAPGATSFADARDGGDGVSYVYRVRAEDGVVASSYSETAAVAPASAAVTTFQAQYYQNLALSGAATERTAQFGNQFSWADGDAQLPAGFASNHFSVRLVGEIEAPTTGSYTFTTKSTGGVRLWVGSDNGESLVIDDWNELPRYPGDATFDDTVDFNDLVKLAQNYNTTGGKTWEQGDFTADGNVDFNDLVKLAQNYNTLQPLRTDTSALPVNLTEKKRYRIVIEFFNAAGPAELQLGWIRPPLSGETGPSVTEDVPQGSLYSPPVTDTIPPTPPSQLHFENTTATSTKLVWTASTDAVGVVGYRVIRKGLSIATV